MDRLTRLPDDIIFHIISFLPLKCSMRTSILAKGWRLKWANAPSLGFTCNQHFGECCLDSKMQQINPNLSNIFHRGSSSSNISRDFESWIATMFTRSEIRNLVIAPNYQLTLPRPLFTCETLVYLRIFDCDSIPNDGAIHFPALKKLQLVNVGHDSESSLEHLLFGCPVLEDLTIERMKAECCDICVAPNLIRLVIDIDEVLLVRLKIPKLRYLRVCVRITKVIVAQPLESLVEADVDIANESNYLYSYYVINFVAALYNVKRLKLSTRRLEVLDSLFYDFLVKFHNLTELNLHADWRFITLLLENADNLRVLTILPTIDPYWLEPKQKPACLESHLETVNLVDFGWSTEHEFDMVKYILREAKVLKEMQITCTSDCTLDSRVKLEAIKRVAMIGMHGSPACNLTFVSFN